MNHKKDIATSSVKHPAACRGMFLRNPTEPEMSFFPVEYCRLFWRKRVNQILLLFVFLIFTTAESAEKIIIDYNADSPISTRSAPDAVSSPTIFQTRDFQNNSAWHSLLMSDERSFWSFFRFERPSDFDLADEELGIRVKGSFTRGDSSGKPVRIDFSVINTRKEDVSRLLQFRIAIPGDFSGWRWWDDIYSSRKITDETDVYSTEDYCGVGEKNSFSIYPFAAVSDDSGRTLFLGIPPDKPRICRLVYDCAAKSLYAQFDFAVSQETKLFPNRADFSFIFFEGENGFRGVLQRYYEMFPDSFSCRSPKSRLLSEGIWMPFGQMKEIKNPRDFFFMFHEISAGGPEVALEDEKFGLSSFAYTEPWSFWMQIPKGEKKDYDNLVRILDRQCSSNADYNGNPVFTIADYANAAKRCALFDKNGKYLVEARSEPWCDGALFHMNASPFLDNSSGKIRADLVKATYEIAKAPEKLNRKTLGQWRFFENGYLVDKTGGKSGGPCIRLSSDKAGEVHGALYSLVLEQKTALPFSVTAYWKSDMLTGNADSDCSLYADLVYQDGSPGWGFNTPFRPGTNDWEKVRLDINSQKPVKTLSLYCLLRNNHTGSIWLDDVALEQNINGKTGQTLLLGTENKSDSRGEIDGIFLDSTEAWGLTQNYRSEHFPFAHYPLCFNAALKKPVILNAFSGLELIGELREMLHKEGKRLMANTVLERYWFAAPMIDIVGTETSAWQNNLTGFFSPVGVPHLAYIRTMAGEKPYLYLLNTNYDLMNYEKYKCFFGICAFFNIYPSMFSIDAASNPFWQNPKWHDPLRPLFLEYIPLILKLRNAGWQPVSGASITEKGSSVLVERYGSGNDIFIGLYNPEKTAKTASFAVDKKILPKGNPWIMDMEKDIYFPYPQTVKNVPLDKNGTAFFNIFNKEALPGKAKDSALILSRLISGEKCRALLDDIVKNNKDPWELWPLLLSEGERLSVLSAYKDFLFWSKMSGEQLTIPPEPVVVGERAAIFLKSFSPGEKLFMSRDNAAEFAELEVRTDPSGKAFFLLDIPSDASPGQNITWFLKAGEKDYSISRFKTFVRPKIEIKAEFLKNEEQNAGVLAISITNFHRNREADIYYKINPASVLNINGKSGSLTVAPSSTSKVEIPFFVSEAQFADYPVAIEIKCGDEIIRKDFSFNYVPEADVPFCQSPPVVDGKPDDWSTSVSLKPFSVYDKALPARKQTEVKLAYDAKCLYVFFQCDEPNPDSMNKKINHRDGAVWEDDCVELFLYPETENAKKIHILVNSSNVIRDELLKDGNGDASWDCAFKSAVKMEDGKWFVEMAIPWEAIGLRNAPEKMSANFNRQEYSAGEASGWSCTYGPFMNPARFGILKFSK